MATLRQKVIIVEAFRALKNGLLESQDSNHRDIEQSGSFLLLCIILSKPPYSCPFRVLLPVLNALVMLQKVLSSPYSTHCAVLLACLPQNGNVNHSMSAKECEKHLSPLEEVHIGKLAHLFHVVRFNHLLVVEQNPLRTICELLPDKCHVVAV